MLDKLVAYGKTLGISVPEECIAAFERYFAELVEWNGRINLTTITVPQEVMIKHFLDSLACLPFLPAGDRFSLLDVGTGAGFPGVPLRVVRELDLVLLDSVLKRVNFLQHLCHQLNLDAVQVIHGRAEELGQAAGMREQFAVVTARALASFNVLAELCLPFVAVGGVFLALKGPGVEEELKGAREALAILGGEIEQVWQYQLPENMGQRSLVVVKKTQETPGKYPRKPGLPNKRPLGK